MLSLSLQRKKKVSTKMKELQSKKWREIGRDACWKRLEDEVMKEILRQSNCCVRRRLRLLLYSLKKSVVTGKTSMMECEIHVQEAIERVVQEPLKKHEKSVPLPGKHVVHDARTMRKIRRAILLECPPRVRCGRFVGCEACMFRLDGCTNCVRSDSSPTYQKRVLVRSRVAECGRCCWYNSYIRDWEWCAALYQSKHAFTGVHRKQEL